ncbi:MAG: asparaginase [Saprospiraceae bacterium]|nr:asparaginase [Saprospiraceae bacterium]
MIEIFVTGGTFDKEYNYITGELTFFESHIEDMLRRGRCGLDTSIKTLMMKDSLELTEEDRQTIAIACQQSVHDRILITHGTDTMVQTAQFLASTSGLEHKVIILMGAMIPYTFGTSSDGFFNLGSGLAFVQTLPPGIYVAMNGRHFRWNNVRKNYNTGFFEALH